MRLSPNTPLYTPSYSKAILSQPKLPTFSGTDTSSLSGKVSKSSGPNWKKQWAMLGLMALSTALPKVHAAPPQGAKGQVDVLTSDVSPFAEFPAIPSMDPQALKQQQQEEAKELQEEGDAKKQDEKMLQAQQDQEKQEQEKTDARLAEKHALVRRSEDDDEWSVCRAPSGRHAGSVILVNWWSSTSVPG